MFQSTNLIPTITGQNPLNDLEHDLFTLPTRIGELGIEIPSKNADRELQSSQKSLYPSKITFLFRTEYSYSIIYEQLKNKANVSKGNKRRNQEEADKVYQQLPDGFERVWIWQRWKELLLGLPF